MGNHFTRNPCCEKVWSSICCCSSRSQKGPYFMKGRVHPVTRIEKLEEKITEANSNGKILLVNFKASWCLPCRKIAPILQELASTYTSMIFVTIDVEELTISNQIHLNVLKMISCGDRSLKLRDLGINMYVKQEFSDEWNVEETPTVMLLKDGRLMDKLVGGDVAELQKKTAGAADLLLRQS